MWQSVSWQLWQATVSPSSLAGPPHMGQMSSGRGQGHGGHAGSERMPFTIEKKGPQDRVMMRAKICGDKNILKMMMGVLQEEQPLSSRNVLQQKTVGWEGPRGARWPPVTVDS